MTKFGLLKGGRHSAQQFIWTLIGLKGSGICSGGGNCNKTDDN